MPKYKHTEQTTNQYMHQSIKTNLSVWVAIFVLDVFLLFTQICACQMLLELQSIILRMSPQE